MAQAFRVLNKHIQIHSQIVWIWYRLEILQMCADWFLMIDSVTYKPPWSHPVLLCEYQSCMSCCEMCFPEEPRITPSQTSVRVPSNTEASHTPLREPIPAAGRATSLEAPAGSCFILQTQCFIKAGSQGSLWAQSQSHIMFP